MTEPLFLRVPAPSTLYKNASFEKEAAKIRLPPDPQTWTQAVYQKAIEKLPELSNFQLDVVLDHEDMQSATALGAVQVMLKQSPQLDNMGMPRPTVPGRIARIPVLIHKGEMFPLDLLVAPSRDGEAAKTVPLNSRRLQQAMFRDDIFDGTSQPPGISSISSSLYPSGRDSFYGGNGSMNFKQASLLFDLLQQREGAKYASYLRRKIATTPAFSENPESGPVLELLLNPPPPEQDPFTEEKVASHFSPKVVQIQDIQDGTYRIKTANPMAWEPKVAEVDRETLMSLLSDMPPEALSELDTEGSLTLGGSDEEEMEEMEEVDPGPKPEVLDKAGLAKVNHEGNELVGYFLPNLIDLSATPLPIALFTNGSVYAIAPEIRGIPVTTDAPSLPSAPAHQARGKGLFHCRDPHRLMATIPMTVVSSTYSSLEGETFLVSTDDGSQTQVKIQPGLRKPVSMDGVLLLPDTFQWMTLEGAEEVDLQQEETPAEIKAASTRVHVRAFSPGHFSLSGPPLEKIGTVQGDGDVAMFHLVGLGLHPLLALEKLAEAAYEGESFVGTPWSIFLPEQTSRYAQEKKAAARLVGVRTPPAPDLIKEAAILQDPESMDAILGLSLLTPDNIGTFLTHIPEMERTQQKLCEMLLASRLGLQELPEVALEKAIQGLEMVIEACFQLRFQQADQPTA